MCLFGPGPARKYSSPCARTQRHHPRAHPHRPLPSRRVLHQCLRPGLRPGRRPGAGVVPARLRPRGRGAVAAAASGVPRSARPRGLLVGAGRPSGSRGGGASGCSALARGCGAATLRPARASSDGPARVSKGLARSLGPSSRPSTQNSCGWVWVRVRVRVGGWVFPRGSKTQRHSSGAAAAAAAAAAARPLQGSTRVPRRVRRRARCGVRRVEADSWADRPGPKRTRHAARIPRRDGRLEPPWRQRRGVNNPSDRSTALLRSRS